MADHTASHHLALTRRSATMAGRTPFARSMVDDDEDVIGDDEHSFAPHHVSGDAGASDDELEQIAAPLHRDSHATFVFAPVPHEAVRCVAVVMRKEKVYV